MQTYYDTYDIPQSLLTSKLGKWWHMLRKQIYATSLDIFSKRQPTQRKIGEITFGRSDRKDTRIRSCRKAEKGCMQNSGKVAKDRNEKTKSRQCEIMIDNFKYWPQGTTLSKLYKWLRNKTYTYPVLWARAWPRWWSLWEWKDKMLRNLRS